jgi:molybdate transport system permease protein
MTSSIANADATSIRNTSEWPFWLGMGVLGGFYLVLILALLWAGASYTSKSHVLAVLESPEVRYSIKLGLLTCSLTMVLAVWVSVPLGYMMARHEFPGKNWVDALLDIPIVLPPLVIGLLFLILFNHTEIGKRIENVFQFTYTIAGIVLAQFTVACAFSVRTMRATFEQMNPRREQVALTLGCSRSQAFWRIVLPEARQGVLTAATLAWARSLGEFGPILVFAGATRMRTEVPATTVFLELSVGNIEAAVAVSFLMILAAVFVLVIIRVFGNDLSLKGIH